MTADISSTLNAWSTTESSNSPSGSTSISTNLDDNLRMIQAVVRNLASTNTIASATTTDLSTINETFITISGTTTVTGLGTLSAGLYKVLIFSGALTLTHNATSLILPDAANVTTTAGDVFIMLSEGSGNWRCVGTTQITAMAGYTTLYNLVVTNANNGYTPTIITGNTTLTSSSNKYIISRASGACTITLPDATTLTAQHDCFIIEYQPTDRSNILTIASNGGKEIYYLTAGTTAKFNLIDNSTAAGIWSESMNQGTKINVYPPVAADYGAYTHFGMDKIDEGHILVGYGNGSTTTIAVMADRGSNMEVIQTLEISASIGGYVDVCVLDSTTAFVAYSEDNQYTYVEEITITASTYALASSYAALQLGNNTSTRHYLKIDKIDSTHALLAYSYDNTIVATNIKANGAAPTQGTNPQTVSGSIANWADIAVLSSTLALVACTQDTTTDLVWVSRIILNGDNITSQSQDSETYYLASSQDTVRIYKMSTTTAILLLDDNGSQSYAWIDASSSPVVIDTITAKDTAATGDSNMYFGESIECIEKIADTTDLYLIKERLGNYYIARLVDATSFTLIQDSYNRLNSVTRSSSYDRPSELIKLRDGRLVAFGLSDDGSYPSAQIITTNHVG